MELSKELIYAQKVALNAMPSIISTIHDDISTHNPKPLLDLVCESAKIASEQILNDSQKKPDSCWYNVYPGEHYRLLAGLISHIKPQCIIDIGTYTGMSARVMLDYTKDISEIHTFDLIDWRKFNTHLCDEDFSGRKFLQHLADLSNPDNFNTYSGLLNNADIILCDGPKDGIFEYKLLTLLSLMKYTTKPRLLILDDIRFENMWSAWRIIKSPKLDASTFGHWSGTGIIDISNGLSIDNRLIYCRQ